MGKLLLKCAQNSPIIHAVILFIGAGLSFVAAYSGGYVSIYIPFISETGAFVPSMCIFSLTLILGSFIGCVFVLYRYIIVSSVITDTMLLRHNWISCATGLFAMLGMAGVAAFPMSTVYAVHLLFAAIYFIGITSYFVMTSFMQYRLEGINRKNSFRIVIVALLLISLFLLVIFFPIGQSYWKKNNTSIPAHKVPDNPGFALVLVSSILEWTIGTLVVIYIVSLTSELKGYGIDFIVSPVSQSSSASAGRDFPKADNPKADNPESSP